MATIERKIVKRGKYNLICRRLFPKDDKKRIAAWRSDLNRILHVLNVRYIAFVLQLLTLYFQTELTTNTRVATPETRHDIDRTVKGQEKDGDNLPVSDTWTVSTTK